LPKQLERNGLKEEEVSISDSTIIDLIRHYTREAGVRGLERQIAKILRKVVKERIMAESKSKEIKSTKVTTRNLEHFSGVRKFSYGIADQEDIIGKVSGLAWTEVGGEMLTIEASYVPGKGNIIKTGSLGEVMQESIQAALTVVRSRSQVLGIDQSFHEKFDVHIHVPEGATPKDGPSAGIGMSTALISLFTGIPVRADTAMTGEITLHGQVLKIGGLKEKLLAAKRAGIQRVIIPFDNKDEIKEIPKKITQSLKIIPVKWVDEVISEALTSEPVPAKNKKTKTVATRTPKNPSRSSKPKTH